MIWIIIGSVLLVLICVILGIECYVYKRVFYSPHKGQNSEYNIVRMKGLEEVGARGTQLVNELLKIPAEDLYATSFDNLKLHAYLYESEGSNEFVICFHGLRRTARRSFAGRTMDLLKAKKNVILVDLRAHGLSKGHTITYGKKEQYDVVTWVNYVKEKFGDDVRITLIGVSMGATIVLAASDKIDERVKIIADSPYMSLEDVVKQTIFKKNMNQKIVYPAVALASILFCHTTLKNDIPKNINNSKNKIIITYGTADSLVPASVIEAVFMSNKDHLKLECFDGVCHGIQYLSVTERYRKMMFDFINN